MGLHLKNLEFTLPKDALCKFWLKLVVLKRRFFKYFQYHFLFRNYLPLEKGVAFQLNKLESPLPKDALCQVWMKYAQ